MNKNEELLGQRKFYERFLKVFSPTESMTRNSTFQAKTFQVVKEPIPLILSAQ